MRKFIQRNLITADYDDNSFEIDQRPDNSSAQFTISARDNDCFSFKN